MPDTKISAMTPAASVMNADLIAIVQALANLRATKQQLLEGGAGENITLKASSLSRAAVENFAGNAFLWINDNANVMLATNGRIDVSAGNGGSSSALTIFANDNVDLVAQLAAPVFRFGSLANGMFITINGPGLPAVNVPYTAAVPGNWAIPVPVDVWTAIDRLVAAVFAGAPGGPV